MKHLKYSLFLLISLVLAVQSFAQPDTRRMNISIGIFSPSATAYDYEGAIGVVGSTGYTVDDIQPGDMFWDDASRYRVDSVEVIVAGSSATVWVTDLYGAGAPQSGKGTLGQPSPRTGIQPMTENGSNFITEAQEAKILTDNLQRLDSLAGDGNGIISALPSAPVAIDANNNALVVDSTSATRITAVGAATGTLVVSGASSLPSTLSHIEGLDTTQVNVQAAGGIGLKATRAIEMQTDTVLFDDFVMRKSAPVGGILSMANYDGRWDIQQAGSAGVLNIYGYNTTPGDPIGMFITGTTGQVMIGDRDADIHGSRLTINGSGFLAEANYNQFLKSNGSITYIGDGEDEVWGLKVAPSEARLGGITSDGGIMSVYVDNSATGDGLEGVRFGDLDALEMGMQFKLEQTEFSGTPTSRVTFGDLAGTYNGSTFLLDDYAEVLNVKVDNGLTVNGSTYTYRLPVTSPSADQVMGDSDGDGNLEYFTPSGADGNGIISALPAAPVTIDANNNPLIIDSTSTTKVTAVGVAKGDLIVSGLSSLPSSLSHIEGVDTAQVNVRAAGGIDVTTTQDIGLNAPLIKTGNSLEFTKVGNNDFIHHKKDPGGAIGYFRILDYGNLDPAINDPIGIEMLHSSTIRRVTIGDSESEYNQTKLYIDDVGSRADLGGYGFGFKYQGGTISLGDHNFDNDGTRFFLDDVNNYIKFGDYFGENPMLFELDNGNSNKTIKIGDISNIRSGIQMAIEDNDFDISRATIGDVNATSNGTLLQVDNNAETITAKADNGVYITGTAYTYTLPVSTPTAADSLDRAMVWRQGTSGFKAVNDSDFRTMSASGNILPYDDVIECVPDVTVHLPAPSTTFQGKIYHIYVGGAGAGGGVTIDVADGSSTIQTNPSISMSSAWEAYTLTCNGSQWVVLNHKP